MCGLKTKSDLVPLTGHETVGVVAAVGPKVKGFKVGNGFGEGITHGPVIHDRAIAKVDEHVRDAEKQGGKILVGGQPMPDLGSNFYQPTVIANLGFT